MKKILSLVVLVSSLSAFSQTSCDERAKYDCRVLVEGNTVSLQLTDRETGTESVFHSYECKERIDVNPVNCKANWVSWMSGKVNDFRQNGFCY